MWSACVLVVSAVTWREAVSRRKSNGKMIRARKRGKISDDVYTGEEKQAVR